MYKFLIMLRDGIDPIYEYLKENTETDDTTSYEEWGSLDLDEVAKKYAELLKTYPANSLRITQDLESELFTSVSDKLGDTTKYVKLVNIIANKGTCIISGTEDPYETNYGYYTIADDGVTLNFVNDAGYCYALFKTVPVNEEKDFTLHVRKETGLQYALLEQPNVLINADEEFKNLKKGLTDFSYEDTYSYVLVQGTLSEINELYKIIKAYATYVYPSDTEAWLKIPEDDDVWVLAYDDITFDIIDDAKYTGEDGDDS